MADQNRNLPILPLSGILIILAALGVTLYQRSPLKNERPSISETYEVTNKARARLWQDPFRAVLDHEEILGKKGSSSTPSRNEISVPQDLRTALPQSSTNKATLELNTAMQSKQQEPKIVILGVMVPGGPYEGDSEWRMRIRYAVLSGLGQSDFVPLDENHVNYIVIQPEEEKIELPQPKPDSKSIVMETVVPYEWMKINPAQKKEFVRSDDVVNSKDVSCDKKSGDCGYVLVVWINDETAGTNGEPLQFLGRLVTAITPTAIRSKVDALKVIGPGSSTNLVKMMEEVRKNTGGEKLTPPDPVPQPDGITTMPMQIFSALATGDMKQMMSLNDQEKYLMQWSQKHYLYNRWFSIERTISNDKEVAKKIIDELCLRDINSDRQECTGNSDGGKKERLDQIVLISEWDNIYSRTLPQTFKTALSEKSNSNNVSWIDEYSYMRGIDGMVPGEEALVSGSTDKKEKKDSSQFDIGEMEKPIGKSQFDYLRRLAIRLEKQNRKLKSEGKHGIRAIGVLGSDYYDKYLIFQALRQELPDALYFTTNLDARMLQTEDLKWTRNIVVGSPYGLAARYAQGEAPPFRDAYQTSLFLTTMYMFGDEKAKSLMEQNQPSVYEIGNKKAYRLSHEQRGVYGHAAEGSDYLHPEGMAWKAPLLAIFASLLLYRSSHTVRKHVKSVGQYVGKHLLRSCGALVASLSFILWFYADIYDRPVEEPFILNSGISIWPTEILRVVAIILSLSLLLRAMRKLDENDTKLKEEFLFCRKNKETNEQKEPREERIARIWGMLKHYKDISVASLHDSLKDAKGDVDAMWNSYAGHGRGEARHVRTAIYVAVFLGFGLSLMLMYGFPYNPIRGSKSLIVDRVLLAASVLTFLYLTFFIVDATRLCNIFIDVVKDTPPQWNDATLDEYRKQVDVAKQAGIRPIHEALLIKLIAERTEIVAKLVLYPFTVLFVMILSRSNYFDKWSTPPHLAVIILLTAVYAWSCAFTLRRSTEKARTRVLERLSRMQKLATGQESSLAALTKDIIEEVKNEHRGAFASFAQQPIVQAVLIPFGGAGSVALLDFLGKLT